MRNAGFKKWRRYTVGRYELGQLNGQAVAVWWEEQPGQKPVRRRFRLHVYDEQQGRAALDRFAREATPIIVETVKLDDLWSLYEKDREKDGKVVANLRAHWKSLQPRFGLLRPSDINKDVCRDYSNTRKHQGKSANTAWTELTQLRTFLNWCVKNHKIDKAPPTWVPLKPKGSKAALTEEEANRLIDAALGMPHVRLFIIMALTTAGRSTAILELTWDRVDFLTGEVDLKAPELVDWMKKRVQKGRAKVLMNDWLREELLVAKNASLTGHVIEWDGEPIKCIRKSFVSVCERAGFGQWEARPTEKDPKNRVYVPSVTPHLLRHTAISWMEEAGIDMSVISRFAGHDDEQTTRKIYSHPRPHKLMKKAAEVVNLRSKKRRSK